VINTLTASHGGVAQADIVSPIWINVPGARVFGHAIIDFDDY